MSLFKRKKMSFAEKKKKYERELAELRKKQEVLKLKEEVRRLKHETGPVGALQRAGKGFAKSLEAASKSDAYKKAMAWTDAWERRYGFGTEKDLPSTLNQARKKKKKDRLFPW